jgi:hypothetical protein
MAMLQNPFSGDDPPEDEDEDESHDPACRCDTCTEYRAVIGADDFSIDLDLDDDVDGDQ